jgi:hypothetical protein
MRYPKRSQSKYAQSRYRVQNWAQYEAGLQMRGALTVWLSDPALEAWRAPASGRPGGQRTYSDFAIEAAVTIRMVFHLPLRQTEGFLPLPTGGAPAGRSLGGCGGRDRDSPIRHASPGT